MNQLYLIVIQCAPCPAPKEDELASSRAIVVTALLSRPPPHPSSLPSKVDPDLRAPAPFCSCIWKASTLLRLLQLPQRRFGFAGVLFQHRYSPLVHHS
jgi:hypothetical protein